MLGLTRRRRQANPYRQVYNFSLVPETDIRLSFCGSRKRDASQPVANVKSPPLAGPTPCPCNYSPETTIGEENRLDAEDRMADRHSLFSIRRQARGALAAGGCDRRRVVAGRKRRLAQPVAQPLLQRIAGK